jgi:hypothetical protein
MSIFSYQLPALKSSNSNILLLLQLIGIFGLLSHIGVAVAQFVPLPPPSPGTTNTPEQTNKIANDHQAPVIEILTSYLKAGKNVFKVRITDQSGIQVGDVRYVHNGQIRVVDLVKDLNNVYKALIDIQPPSRVIVVEATDANGNVATTVKEYSIHAAPNLFQQIENFFSGIFGTSH